MPSLIELQHPADIELCDTQLIILLHVPPPMKFPKHWAKLGAIKLQCPVPINDLQANVILLQHPLPIALSADVIVFI